MENPKTLVLGMGNTISGNDGVGIIAARAITEAADSWECEVIETQEAGINLLGTICGYRKAIIIDSIRTVKGKPGEIYRFTQADFKPSLNRCSSHQMGLATVLDIGRELNLDVPGEVTIYAVEIGQDDNFKDGLSAPVNGAVSKLLELIKTELCA